VIGLDQVPLEGAIPWWCRKELKKTDFAKMRLGDWTLVEVALDQGSLCSYRSVRSLSSIESYRFYPQES